MGQIGLPGRAQQAGRPVWITDIATDDNFPRFGVAQACGLRSAVAFPVLCGEEGGAHRDCLLLGTALALELAGVVAEPHAGMQRAAAAIDGGAARRLLEALPRQGTRVPP